MATFPLIDWSNSSWVRTLSVTMYLDLKNGSYMPHKLMPVQESPVALLKFKMATRLRGTVKKFPEILYSTVIVGHMTTLT